VRVCGTVEILQIGGSTVKCTKLRMSAYVCMCVGVCVCVCVYACV